MPELGNFAMPRSRGTSAPTSTITLEVTSEMMTTLQQMASDSGQPLDVVFTHAIALYHAAMRATAGGKHIGYASSPDGLEVEFTGIDGAGGRARADRD